MAIHAIPYIDPNVKHVGVSKLRELNSTRLRDIAQTLVIQENDVPLAVLLKYEQFLAIQKELESVLNTIEVLTSEEESAALAAGLSDLRAGRTRSVSEIRAALRKRRKR